MAKKEYTRSFKLDVLVYKLKNPKVGYTDLSKRFGVARSSISAWANDFDLVEEASIITKNPQRLDKLEQLKIERKNMNKKENLKEMLYDTIDTIYDEIDSMKASDRIRFVTALKDVINSEVFTEKASASKTVMRDIIEKYGIDESKLQIAQA